MVSFWFVLVSLEVRGKTEGVDNDHWVGNPTVKAYPVLQISKVVLSSFLHCSIPFWKKGFGVWWGRLPVFSKFPSLYPCFQDPDFYLFCFVL